MAKQFGLIKSDKTKVIIRPSIFNESSDSDDNSHKPTGIQALKKKERLAQDKVLAEDPTVYQYDELYDDMQSKRTESKLARKDLDKKPKYISKLLETAERRKRENERRIERQVQKEREEEGDEFKDKESFVTTAYKKKLEEMKQLEEKEKREEYLETIGDVKKQGDLSGFYRHLYAQQVNFDEEKQKLDKQKDVKNEESNLKKPKEHKTLNQVKRKYRKRADSKSSSDDSEKDVKLEHLLSNLDADSDFSIDSASDDESTPKKVKCETVTSVTIKTEVEDIITDKNTDTDKKLPIEEPDIKKEDIEEIPIVEKVVKKPKKDIWKKRTVGEVFDEALKKYYERKAAKLITV